VNLPLAVFFPEDKQLVISFLHHFTRGVDSRFSRRRGTAVSQVADFNDFVDGEDNIQRNCVEDLVVARLYGIASNQRRGKLRHEDRIAPVKSHSGLRVAGVERLFIGLEKVDNFLVHQVGWFGGVQLSVVCAIESSVSVSPGDTPQVLNPDPHKPHGYLKREARYVSFSP
jgi:hypothetical protein